MQKLVKPPKNYRLKKKFHKNSIPLLTFFFTYNRKNEKNANFFEASLLLPRNVDDTKILSLSTFLSHSFYLSPISIPTHKHHLHLYISLSLSLLLSLTHPPPHTNTISISVSLSLSLSLFFYSHILFGNNLQTSPFTSTQARPPHYTHFKGLSYEKE